MIELCINMIWSKKKKRSLCTPSELWLVKTTGPILFVFVKGRSYAMHCEWCRPLLQGHSIIFLYEGCVNGLICLGNFGLKVLKLAKMDFHNSKFLHTNNSLIWYRIQLLPVHVNGLNHPVGPFLDPLRAHFNDQNRSSFRCRWDRLPRQKSRRSGIVWYYYFKACIEKKRITDHDSHLTYLYECALKFCRTTVYQSDFYRG